ncbi:MAG: hypothetical protein Q9166_005586 [cf. Caloplaca sp. 2 TL-2023]
MTDHKARKRSPEGGQPDGFSLLNGSREDVVGNEINGDLDAATASRAQPLASPGAFSRQLPPEIEHITLGYLPLSVLITRLIQDTFNGMTEVINGMSELQIPQMNGSTPANPSQVSVQKKLSLLDFAQDRRAKFIKILVLSQWSRQVEAIRRVIDMKIWLDNQRNLYDGTYGACNWIGELKRIMALERIPNPDLKTALEALSLGKAPGLPDLGYLPPKQVSPQQFLKVLRSINTKLTIRLRLHETVPAPLKHFSISNGRATFRVPKEFEIDLSIANEDPSSQLYFIDFRFLFSPAPAELPQGRVRDDLEARVNMLLGQEGLKGCYRFLHDFVLSHKLNVFRHQAFRMSQGNWSEHLKVEIVHRSLVIQYWVTRLGLKSWIELGVRRRKLKRTSWVDEEEDEPHIGIRWFRAAKEVTDVPLTFDLEELSIEAILKRIISTHTNFIFRQTKAKLREGHLYPKKSLRLKHARSSIASAASSLSVQLTASQSCSVIQETVSGKLMLLPPSSLHSRAEREMNGLVEPENSASACIAHLRAITAYEEVEHVVKCYGWQVVKSIRPQQESLRHHFGRDNLKAGFFRKKSWDVQWLLAFTASVVGDFWWIVELDNKKSQHDSIVALGPSIRTAFKVPETAAGLASRELAFLTLSRIEHTSAGLMSQYTDSRELTVRKIPHRLVKTSRNRPSSEFPTLHVHLPKDSAKPSLRSQESAKTARISRLVRLMFMGVDQPSSHATHLAVALTDCATLRSRRLGSTDEESVVFHPTSGAFAFCLRGPVGQSAIPSLLDRLAKIQRLVDYVTMLPRFKVPSLSLNHLEFTYATDPQDLRAKISVGEGPPRISFNAGNPHLRIQDQLTVPLRKLDGFKHVIFLLSLTLPLMRTLASILAAHPSGQVTILPRSAEWYQIRYQRPPGRFDLRLRRRRENFMWYLEEAGLPDGRKLDQRVRDQFRSVVKEKGEGWDGVSPGIAATPDGVEVLLKKIDDLVRQVSAMEHAPPSETQNYKAQKRKREDDEVVVLD